MLGLIPVAAIATDHDQPGKLPNDYNAIPVLLRLHRITNLLQPDAISDCCCCKQAPSENFCKHDFVAHHSASLIADSRIKNGPSRRDANLRTRLYGVKQLRLPTIDGANQVVVIKFIHPLVAALIQAAQ